MIHSRQYSTFINATFTLFLLTCKWPLCQFIRWIYVRTYVHDLLLRLSWSNIYRLTPALESLGSLVVTSSGLAPVTADVPVNAGANIRLSPRSHDLVTDPQFLQRKRWRVHAPSSALFKRFISPIDTVSGTEGLNNGLCGIIWINCDLYSVSGDNW